MIDDDLGEWYEKISDTIPAESKIIHARATNEAREQRNASIKDIPARMTE